MAKKQTNKKPRVKPPRNDSLFDNWSIVHVCTGLLFGWLMDPFTALLIMVLWEPLEIFILSPVLWRYGILFGHETINNSLSDIFFDALGVALGYWLISHIITPPFTLF